MNDTVFLAGYGPHASEPDLVALFERAGATVKRIVFPIHRETGQRRSFAFVRCASAAEATRVIERLAGTEFMGRILVATPAREKSALPPMAELERTRLYLANLPYDVRPGDLVPLLSPFSTVLSVRMLIDDAGASRGVFFVTLETREAALAAVDTLNGAEAFGRILRVHLARECGPERAG